VELASAFAAAGERLLEPVRRHATLVRELASMGSQLALLGGARDTAEVAGRAKSREREADEIVVEVRSLVERIPEEGAFGKVVAAADDAADEIEEAIFVLTLLPAGFVPAAAVRAALVRLRDLVDGAAHAWIACVDSAQHARRGAVGAELRAFVDAVDRVVTIERESDDAERQAEAALMACEGIDARALVVVSRAVEHLEGATDALLHAALTLRDHALGAVMIERD
jgi:uncharacterized protein Yka (UPF0111/DUF47 family)